MGDYITGDALKQIHWKATAKEQKLKIRNRTGEEKQGIAILFDTKRYSRRMHEYIPVENKILETVLALSAFLSEKNISLQACYGKNGLKQTCINNLHDFDDFYETVSELVYQPEESFMQTLQEALRCGVTLHNRVLLCVLHELTQELMQLTEQLTEAGILVVLYVVTENLQEEYLRQSNERRKLVVIPVEAELEGRL